MSYNIGYHTRLYSDSTHKVLGGSFGGTLCEETAQRLVNAHFTVTVKPSGAPVFVDKAGREVRLYMTVDPASTKQGNEALRQWLAVKAAQEAAGEELREQQDAEVSSLMEGLTHEELVRRLKGGST